MTWFPSEVSECGLCLCSYSWKPGNYSNVHQIVPLLIYTVLRASDVVFMGEGLKGIHLYTDNMLLTWLKSNSSVVVLYLSDVKYIFFFSVVLC